MSNEFKISRATLEEWRNDLSMHGVGDIECAKEIDIILSESKLLVKYVEDFNNKVKARTNP